MPYTDYNKRKIPLEGLFPGRIVHYQTQGRDNNPAIVNVVHDNEDFGYIDLIWWDEQGLQNHATQIPYEKDIKDAPYTWHWPRNE